MKAKLYLFVLISLVYSLLSNVPAALAVQEFTTDYASNYEIELSGNTNVTHTINIKNNLAQIFPREYTLSIGSSEITNIHAVDGSGQSLPVDTLESDTQQSIHVTLTTPNIGQGQTTTIIISYQTPDVIVHTGSVWEVNIPKLKQGGEMNSVKRSIVLPATLGTPTSAVPTPDSITSLGDKTTVSYTSNKSGSISLLFGTSQWYQLTIKYHLQPPLTKGSYTEIALPPDTAYQRVILDSLTPAPETITIDQDGNWLARYGYAKDFATEVTGVLMVEVSPLPIYKDPSSTNNQLYTAESKYWQTNSSLVKRTAERLKSPKNIYDYLTSSFTYNYSRVVPGADRLGAAKALESPSLAICTEFTDTFVALSRSLGIPAREINGYAVTSNTKLRPLSLATDVLHAWPEYYDQEKGIWTQVDPTWGNTTGGLDYFSKLDYNHITFARHGVEPTYPYPAGVYKENVEDKTLSIELIEPPRERSPIYEVIKQEDNKYQIKNTGTIALTDTTIDLPDGSQYELSYLPPMGSITSESVLGTQAASNKAYILVLASLGLIIVTGLGIYLTIRLKKGYHT